MSTRTTDNQDKIATKLATRSITLSSPDAGVGFETRPAPPGGISFDSNLTLCGRRPAGGCCALIADLQGADQRQTRINSQDAARVMDHRHGGQRCVSRTLGGGQAAHCITQKTDNLTPFERTDNMKPCRYGPMMVVLLLCVATIALAGCKSNDQTAALFATLQQGKAAGSLILTTDGKVGVGATQQFFLGTTGTALSFRGKINFAGADFGPLATRAIAKKMTRSAPPGSPAAEGALLTGDAGGGGGGGGP